MKLCRIHSAEKNAYFHRKYNMNSTKANSMDANSICGVMVSVLTSSMIDRGFELQSDRTKDYKIGILLLLCKAHSIKLQEQMLVGSESG
jgi:hypothetical protein